MRNLISFVHISLDGFVAGPNGEMDWIILNEEVFDHVGERIGKTDAALYGRKTYELMEGYWPNAAKKTNATKHEREHSAWYATAHKLILSNSMKGQQAGNADIISDNYAEKIREIKHTDGSEILVFGSPTATHSLIRAGLIDGYWFFVNPIVLGNGIPLFGVKQNRSKLELKSSKQFDCGVIELNYSAGR